MKFLPTKWIAALCVGVCATVAVLSVNPAAEHFQTEDRNGDHRPDVWLRFDDRGDLAEVDIDTNFDGQPDVQEYYEHDQLVRREVDRNFNGRTDLVEEFDADTREQTRSVVDVDDDGTADVLVLFRDGQPVFSKYEPSSRAPLVGATTRGKPASEPRSGGDRLVPLRDPFRAETSVSRPRGIPTSFAFVGLSTATGLPESPVDPSSSVALTRLSVFGAEPVALPPLLASSPRAPPLSL